METGAAKSEKGVGDRCSATIRVSNLPPNATKDDITIHFQKRKHGGGDVVEVRMTKDGLAHVTFENEETVEAVLSRGQTLNGTALQVTRYRPLPQAPAESGHATTVPQVFEDVTATINREIFATNDPSARDLMEQMKAEVSVDFQSTAAGFQVMGTLEELQRAQEFLTNSRLYGTSGYQLESEEQATLENLKIAEQSVNVEGGDFPRTRTGKGADAATDSECDLGSHELRRKDVQRVSYAVTGIRTEVESDHDSKKYQPGRQGIGAAKKGIESQRFETMSLPLKFFLHFNSEVLDGIRFNFDVDIKPAADHTSVLLIPGDDCNPDEFNGACDEFFCYYQGACTGMIRDDITLDFPSDKSLDDYPAENIEIGLPVLLERGKSSKELVLYGDTASVMVAKERLLSLSDSWRFSGASMVYRNHGEESDLEPRVVVTKKTPTGTSLTVWKGDITRMNVKAIVNPANTFLKHTAGLARAIRKAGGKVIQEESDAIVVKCGEVEVGSAVHTTAGRLPCEMVIHAVGPQWWSHDDQECEKLLFKACLDSLQVAQKAGLESIAFPAISSGLYGVPLAICAGTMLNAIEEYVQANASQKTVVSDIRFVHIDDDAVELFTKELTNRYTK